MPSLARSRPSLALPAAPVVLALTRKSRARDWDESKHPRVPEGGPGGGEFTSGGGGDAAPADTVADPDRPLTAQEQAAARARENRSENVRDYEHRPVNYAIPFEKNSAASKFADKAEFDAVKGAISDYKEATGDGDAYSVNRALRGKDAMTPRVQQAVDNLDTAFARTAAPITDYKTKQPKDAWLYRGLDRRYQPDLKVGDEFQDNGFISTTIKSSFAKKWAREHGEGGSLAQITVPAGTKVMPVKDTGNQDEGEVLLPRGTRFRVTKAGKNAELQVVG